MPPTIGFAEMAPLRRSTIATAVMGFAVIVWIVGGASPAAADEFTIGIVVESGVGEGASAAFVDGFQLAVDQSPDVSHPPDTEGGDHLGSMDVRIVVVADRAASDELVDATIDMTEREGAAIVVADISPEVLAAIYLPITRSGTMLITMAGTHEVELPITLYFFAAADHDRLEDLLVDGVPSFEEAFLAAYGYPPSDAAARGYLAGRLVDIAVEATDRDPSDVDALAAGLVAAAGSAPTATVDTAAPVEEAAPVETATPTTPAEGRTPVVESRVNGALVAIIMVIAGIGILAYGVLRRRRTKPG